MNKISASYNLKKALFFRHAWIYSQVQTLFKETFSRSNLSIFMSDFLKSKVFVKLENKHLQISLNSSNAIFLSRLKTFGSWQEDFKKDINQKMPELFSEINFRFNLK